MIFTVVIYYGCSDYHTRWGPEFDISPNNPTVHHKWCMSTELSFTPNMTQNVAKYSSTMEHLGITTNPPMLVKSPVFHLGFVRPEASLRCIPGPACPARTAPMAPRGGPATLQAPVRTQWLNGWVSHGHGGLPESLFKSWGTDSFKVWFFVGRLNVDSFARNHFWGCLMLKQRHLVIKCCFRINWVSNYLIC